MPYGLKPGQLLPAQNTNEKVKGGFVITILQVTNVITGPKSTPGQWAKSGSAPNNAYVIGCIIPEKQIRAFNAVMNLTSKKNQNAILSGLKTVLQSPSD